MKALTGKRSAKEEREYKVLIGLVREYLKSGKPVGSNSLKEAGFKGLSSATIRNYFANLEREGFLIQQHASGGRIPTDLAYRLYAHSVSDSEVINEEVRERFDVIRLTATQEITALLQRSAEVLSDTSKLAVFLSAPRFDHDFILDIKLVAIDTSRCLCVLITNFGVVKTEVLHTEKKLSAFAIKRIESYFHWRLTGHDKPEGMEPEEEEIAKSFYNEVIIRYIVGYAHFTHDEVYKTGFSKLLEYPEFDTAPSIAQGLALFENEKGVQHLLTECSKSERLKWWIGDDLELFTPGTTTCSAIAYPYHVGPNVVGAVGLLGPMRMPYEDIFGMIKQFSADVSEALTRNLYKHQLSYRKPEEGALFLEKQDQSMISDTRPAGLLENKSENT